MIEEKLGSYAIVKTVGSGTMGTVYQAEDRRNGRMVAVKLIRSRVLPDAAKRERFLQGLLRTCEIRHKNLCPILEIGDDDDDFYVITPFLEGMTLRQRMDGRPLPWREAVRIALLVAETLDAVHEAGSVHRSVNPSNLWLVADGTVLLTDCGMATFTETDPRSLRRAAAADHARSRIPMNALAFMSPEQIRGNAVDRRTDIFALGAVLHTMLTGTHRFEPRGSFQRAGATNQNFPADLHAIMNRAVRHAPEARYQQMRDLICDLRRVSAIDEREAVDPAPDTPAPGRRRFPRVNLATAALLLVILITMVYYLLVR